MIIDKCIPKLPGENLHFLSLSLQVINLITSLKCKQSPHCFETKPRLAQSVEPEIKRKGGKSAFLNTNC